MGDSIVKDVAPEKLPFDPASKCKCKCKCKCNCLAKPQNMSQPTISVPPSVFDFDRFDDRFSDCAPEPSKALFMMLSLICLFVKRIC